jgi:hypothetical protein
VTAHAVTVWSIETFRCPPGPVGAPRTRSEPVAGRVVALCLIARRGARAFEHPRGLMCRTLHKRTDDLAALGMGCVRLGPDVAAPPRKAGPPGAAVASVRAGSPCAQADAGHTIGAHWISINVLTAASAYA